LPDERVKVVYSLADALATKPEAALICNPAPFHISTATPLADAGAHIFMEKPVSDSMAGLEHLLETCAHNDLVFFLAYPLRFDLALQAMRDAIAAGEIGRPLLLSAEVGQHLPDWRPQQDYRNGVSARKNLGGGALLELSHELDYVRWLMGDVLSVSARLTKQSNLEIDVEDTVDLILEFKNGAAGTIHLDMVRQPPSRKCVVSGSDGTLEWDGMRATSSIWTARTGEWRDLSSGGADRNDMYMAELKHFLACVAGEGKALTAGTDGKRVLELILAARESSDSGKVVVL
jgi:predicted dehydrogenase